MYLLLRHTGRKIVFFYTECAVGMGDCAIRIVLVCSRNLALKSIVTGMQCSTLTQLNRNCMKHFNIVHHVAMNDESVFS